MAGAEPEDGGRRAEGGGRALGMTGQRFGNYELLEKVGQGGMGVVYKARQVNLDRIVALKLLPFGQFSREDVVQRFQTEAAAAAGLQHPHIVAIHDVGEQEGQHYFSMDFIEGQTLAEVVREKPLPARRAASYLKTIAEAVHYAHQHGILHRDLKPSNILIDRSDQPRITDFGLAKRLTVDSDMTLTGQVLGSPNFMAPEQAEGRLQAIGLPTEVYSLGALLYHLLTRQPPFQAETLTTLLKQVIEIDPVPPRLLNPSIPQDLETICLKCLEKEPGKRYATAQMLADELGRFLDGQPVLARPIGAAGKAWRWCRRNPRLATAVAAAFLSLLIGLAGVAWQWRRAESERARADARERFARQSTYAADMHLAQLALADNRPGLAVSLLEQHRPGGKSEIRNRKSEIDLRGWEWRYLWRLCQGDESSTLHRYPGPIPAMAVSKDGRLLALATGGQVALWDLTTRRPLAGLPTATTGALAFSPADNHLPDEELSSGASGALAFSPADNLLAAGTLDATGQAGIALWDPKAGRATRTLKYEARIRSVGFSPDGRLLATFDNRGGVKVVDWTSGQILTNFTVSRPRQGRTGVVAFSPDGNRLAIGEDHGQIRLLDLRTGTFMPLQVPPGFGVMTLAFSPASEFLGPALPTTSEPSASGTPAPANLGGS